jgi:hypothetical protein
VKIWKILNYLAFSSKPTHSCSQYWYMFVWSELINHKVWATLDKVMFFGCLFQQNIKLIERTFVHFHVWSGVWWWWLMTWPQWARWKNNRKHFGRHLFSISFRCFFLFFGRIFKMLNFRGFFGFVSLCVCVCYVIVLLMCACVCVCMCGLCVKMKPSFSKNLFSRWVSSKKSFNGRG